MNQKELILELAGRNSVPRGELREAMFKFHNSMVGKTRYIHRHENPKTSCGSCVQRVLKNVMKWYHNDENAPKYSEIEFTGKLGLNNIPVYRRK